jgi:hypothetical protein
MIFFSYFKYFSSLFLVNQKNNNKTINNNNKRTVQKKNRQKRKLNAEKNSKNVNENENLLSIELFIDFVF